MSQFGESRLSLTCPADVFLYLDIGGKNKEKKENLTNIDRSQLVHSLVEKKLKCQESAEIINSNDTDAEASDFF